jgi:hypothetical protein
MAHHVTDDLDRRLRAARPRAADTEDTAFDAELLARIRTEPIAARRTVPRVVAPVAVGATLTATAVVMLAGGPGDVGGPSSAAAITQALRWLNPPPHTILHVRSVESMGGRTTTMEYWQSADHPTSQRMRVTGDGGFETAGDEVYDAARDTIYDAPGGKRIAPPGRTVADPVVQKVRSLLADGHMTVTGRERHNGVDAWAISLKRGFGRPVWTLWVSAADGRPLELRDPGRDANEPPQVIRWPTYEVLPASRAERFLTLKGAHPTARVVNDRAQSEAAAERLMPSKG